MSHSLGGGGAVTLVGTICTIYITNLLSLMTDTYFQNVHFQGNAAQHILLE